MCHDDQEMSMGKTGTPQISSKTWKNRVDGNRIRNAPVEINLRLLMNNDRIPALVVITRKISLEFLMMTHLAITPFQSLVMSINNQMLI